MAEGVLGGFGYGTRNQESERIFELDAALHMFVCSPFFKKRDSRLVTYVFGTVRTQLDYFMVKSKDRKFVRDVKVAPGKEVVHQLLLCDLIVRPMKNYRKIFVSKVWRLQKTSIRNEFVSQFRDESSTIDKSGGVESMWKSLETDLLESTDTVCG